MATSNRAPAYVLGLSPTGLTIVRALGRHGIPVVGIHHHPNEPALQSRYCQVKLLPPVVEAEAAWLEFLLEEGRRHLDDPIQAPAAGATLDRENIEEILRLKIWICISTMGLNPIQMVLPS